MATLKEVAELAGVSTATASYVLNNRKDKKVTQEVARRVRDAAGALDYRPNLIAKALRQSRANLIGVLSEDITTYQVNHIVEGIIQETDRAGYHMVMGDLNLNQKIWHDGIQDYGRVPKLREEIQEKVDLYRAAGVGGILYVGMHDRDVGGLFRTELPLVYAYSYTKNPEDYMVNTDNQQAAMQITAGMAAQGRRRIGLISGPVDSVPAYMRLMGYQTALMESGIPYDPSLVVYGNWSDVAGEECCRRLLALPEAPDAIVSMNDWMAIGAMRVLKERGLVPGKEILITGFDDIELCRFVEPKLSTVRVPLSEVGRAAARKMIALLGGEEPPHWELLPCTIVERETFRFRVQNQD